MNAVTVPPKISDWESLDVPVIESWEPLDKNGLYVLMGRLQYLDNSSMASGAVRYELSMSLRNGQSPRLSLYVRFNHELDRVPDLKGRILSVTKKPVDCIVGLVVNTDLGTHKRAVNYLSFPDGLSVVLKSGRVVDYSPVIFSATA
ncbi:hypothetical protein HYU18_00115 [Candidatus Woesearchaeota archaeon]|nr:hypothetical protein [Candidatus Woesearchaeota archaeon]